jgi:Flp pilus assembly protein TadD
MGKLRVGWVFLGLAFTAGLGSGADDPPWKRVLKGDDARKATELERRLDEFEEAGKFAEAHTPARELLALRERVQGAGHWQTQDARRLVETLQQIAGKPVDLQKALVLATKQTAEAEQLYQQGRYARAEVLYRQALGVRQKVLGAEHPHTAGSLDRLAGSLDAQGRYAQAEPLLRQALAIRQKVLGTEHPGTALSLNNLAVNLHAQGRYIQAESLIRQALAISRQLLGAEHPNIARKLNNLAMNLNAQGQYAQAEPVIREALAIKQKVLGAEHPHTALSLHNLAVNLSDQGLYAQAEVLDRQALAIRQKVLGAEHPDTAQSLDNLALNLRAQGQYAQAEVLDRQALVIRQKVLGAEHPDTAQSLNGLALNLYCQGRYAQAEALLRQALAIRQKVLGAEHPDTAQGLSNLALNLDAQGRYAQAEPLYRQALAICQKVLGAGHSRTATSLNNLAVNLDAQGRYAQAEPLYRQALAIKQKVAGAQHSDTATSLNNLAGNLNAQGRYTQAEPLYRQALAICQKVLGAQHPDTAQSLDNLAKTVYIQGRYAQAEPLLRKAAASFEAARLRITAAGLDRAPFAAERSPLAGLASCLARLGQPTDAWQFAESGLARGLLDDLAARTAPPVSPKEQQRRQLQNTRLDYLDRKLVPLLTATQLSAPDEARRDVLSRERAALQAELARDAAAEARREVYPLNRIQVELPADAALLFWIDLRTRAKTVDPLGDHWACIIRRLGTPTWVRLVGSGPGQAWTEDDDRLPQQVQQALAHGENDWRDLAHRLAAQRLVPLQPALAATTELPPVSRLITVPAGRMAGIPLDALTDRYAISYAPSGTLYARLRERHRPLRDPTLLALGDPDFALPASPPPPAAPEYGLLLTVVPADGNAFKARLRGGDVLLRYGDTKLTTRADLKVATEGGPVPVQVWRDGRTLDLKVPPGKLGVEVSPEPAAEALRQWRAFTDLVAARTRDDIRPLPASRVEVSALAALFPKGKAQVWLGSQASEQKLDELIVAKRLKDFRLLHFATHGKMDPVTAARSALLLARDQLPDPFEQARLGKKVYDGRLTVEAIRTTWELDADLVTLSACETALGPDGGGEGNLGFARVLLLKGARSLLLSLWKVDDTATALLMQRFYQNLLAQRPGLQGRLPKAEALREAQAWLRQLPAAERDRLAAQLGKAGPRGDIVPKKPVVPGAGGAAQTPYAHPRYWAAFILIGDPE